MWACCGRPLDRWAGWDGLQMGALNGETTLRGRDIMLALKGEDPGEIPGVYGPSALGDRADVLPMATLWVGWSRQGWVVGAAGEPPKPWGGSRFPLLEETRVVLHPCIFTSDRQTCLVFSQNCSGCQGKGIGNFSGEATRGIKAEGIGGVLIQVQPGAVGAPAATPADGGM